MSRAAWLVPALLAVALGLRLADRLRAPTTFATMPILTPTSLVYEAQLRQARGQPAGMGGMEAFLLAERLLAAPDSIDPALAPELSALAEDRAALLALRDRRHGLNTSMMEVGVEVAARLRPDQWDAIHMRRDALRAEAEAQTFDRLLQRLK